MDRSSGLVAALVAMSSALATGCSTADPSGGPTSAGPTLAAVSEVPAAETTPSEPAGRDPRFGHRFAYASGLRVRIAEPKSFRPSAWIERLPGTPTRFVVVVDNKTGEEWNPSQLHVTLQSGFTSAPQIYDAEQGIVARPEARVRDGRSVTFSVGYWVTDPDDLTMEFAPGFGYQSTVVTK